MKVDPELMEDFSRNLWELREAPSADEQRTRSISALIYIEKILNQMIQSSNTKVNEK